ncbi:MAG TPA: ATP-binding protein [Candidatus Acidoferrales bacterium]|nr:ATP-binding protein [Candidatus Acidoferrales bacterium]
MSFRTKLLFVFSATVVAAVTLVAWAVSTYARRAFERLDSQRSEALVAQFRREFSRRGEEVVRRVEGIADAEATVRMAIDLNRPQADPSLYVNDARGLATSHQLDFVEISADDGTLISSADWPARLGHKNDWVTLEKGWRSKGAFLRRVELPENVALSLTAVRTVRVGEKNLYIIGGQRLDKEFLASLVLPAGMRALLYRNLEPTFVPSALTDASGEVAQADRFALLIEQVRRQLREVKQTIQWTPNPADTETFHAIPLTGRHGELLGVLLVGSSRREMATLVNFIRNLSLVVAGGGILLGLFLSWWVSARVTRPVERLAAGAREVAAGEWETRVDVGSRDEIGELARAFNNMTQQLLEQRERLVQAERVAAWRELARRLAHELKNPLFPLQITVENLQRAREQKPEQFDEVFRESTTTLRAELQDLNAIVGRFSDFARMPAPELQPVNINEAVRSAVKLFEAQFSAVGRPPITPELYLDEGVATIQADPELLHRALQNLVLNSLDAMPGGGTLTIRTAGRDGAVRLEVSDTGTGLTQEECARLFTPYYSTKQHGTGLGLAIVQSVVSDHGGRISVESKPGCGTTFRIELPAQPPQGAPS